MRFEEIAEGVLPIEDTSTESQNSLQLDLSHTVAVVDCMLNALQGCIEADAEKGAIIDISTSEVLVHGTMAAAYFRLTALNKLDGE